MYVVKSIAHSHRAVLRLTHRAFQMGAEVKARHDVTKFELRLRLSRFMTDMVEVCDVVRVVSVLCALMHTGFFQEGAARCGRRQCCINGASAGALCVSDVMHTLTDVCVGGGSCRERRSGCTHLRRRGVPTTHRASPVPTIGRAVKVAKGDISVAA